MEDLDDDQFWHIARDAKSLMILGMMKNPNALIKSESLKFLYEYQLYYDKWGDRFTPLKLRSLAQQHEEKLGIDPLKRTMYDDNCEPFVNNLIEPKQTYRDNDKHRMREMYSEKWRQWVPIFDYNKRDELAMEFCLCDHCYQQLTKKRKGQPIESNKPNNTNDNCVKNRFNLTEKRGFW